MIKNLSPSARKLTVGERRADWRFWARCGMPNGWGERVIHINLGINRKAQQKHSKCRIAGFSSPYMI
jgi:hypothetical protein